MNPEFLQPPANDQHAALGLSASRCWAPSSYFGGCKDHPHRTDLSCCKIRRADGSPLTTADAWGEIQRLREALKWAEAYVPKRADCETRRMIESLLPNVAVTDAALHDPQPQTRQHRRSV